LVAAENDDILFEIAPKKQDWYVSTASIVDGILLLISSKPKNDRDLLQQASLTERKRSILGLDKAPLRKYYLENNDKLIFSIISNFFKASYGTLFKKDTYLYKTVGIQAQFGVLKVILEKYLERDKDISENYFKNILKDCSNIDFSDNFYTASGLGKSRIYNSLLIKLGFKDFGEIPNKIDLSHYERILNKV